MTRAIRLRAFFALAVLALSLYVTVTVPARLGLDLRGGTQIVLETRDAPEAKADGEATDRTLEVLRRRVDGLGVAEPSLARSGDNRIIVELPGVEDPREAADVLGRTARLTFHPVLGAAAPDEAGNEAEKDKKSKKNEKDTNKTDKDDELVLPDEQGQRLRLGPSGLDGQHVESAEASIDQEGGAGWYVSVDLRGPGKDRWADLTGKAACAPDGDPTRRVAIVLDDEVISSPQVQTGVSCGTGITGGSTMITGSFDQEEAEDLALLINGGALPVPVDTVEQRTVGPTLGAAAIESSAQAAVIGVVLTSLFIVVIYRLFGLLAAIALACYGLVSYAALAALGATLTLPGLAGFVLAIGMAVDANVLVFERAREEFTGGRSSLRSALVKGFRYAFSAIADSNVTTLIAAGLLFFLASGPVRGFGVTLGIGVIASMFSALVVTRVLAELAVARPSLRRRPQLSGIANAGRVRQWLTRRDPDLMRHGRRWLALSLAAAVLAVSGIVTKGLNFGVEFTGGRLLQYSTSTSVDPDRARDALSDAGFPQAVVQTSGDEELTVRTGELSDSEARKVTSAVTELGGEGTEKQRDELIGPSLSDELRRGALIALGVALLGQLLYLSVRFRWTYATSSVVALSHDALILVGVFAWLGKPIDGVFLAALLTVIGYSVNDTVVVFDRVRELLTKHRKKSFKQVSNLALLQTVPRTVNTGMGALFILSALAVLGGDSLRDFAIALLIGIVVGTYSSMFTAAPLAIELESRSGGRR